MITTENFQFSNLYASHQTRTKTCVFFFHVVVQREILIKLFWHSGSLPENEMGLTSTAAARRTAPNMFAAAPSHQYVTGHVGSSKFCVPGTAGAACKRLRHHGCPSLF